MGAAMPRTKKRIERQGQMARNVDMFMQKYDVSKTGTLSRSEVEAMATELLNEYTPLVGGLTSEDVDMIMACGGDTVKSEIAYKDLPVALGVMASVRELNKEYHELFMRHDKDKSGSLPASQLMSLLQEVNSDEPPSESDVLFILRKLEPRGVEDPITEPQLKAAMACWYCRRPSVQDEIKEMFKAWDTSGTGSISKQEFTTVMKKLNGDFTDAQLDRLFNAADKAGNGVLDYKEFVDFVWDVGMPVGTSSEPISAERFREPKAVDPTEDEKKKMAKCQAGK